MGGLHLKNAPIASVIRLVRNGLLLFIALSSVLRSIAQETGSVSGDIVCDDTHGPARFAIVRILALDAEGGAGAIRSAKADSNGHFQLKNLPAGLYTASAMLNGYVSEEHLKSDTGDGGRASRRVFELRPGQQGTIQIVIFRGASLSGSVQYDDGAPAIGLQVSASLLRDHENGAKASSSSESLFSNTDDTGAFRVSGLPPGAYSLTVSFPDGYTGPTLFPITERTDQGEKGITRFEVEAGENRSGISLRVRLSQLHRVSGTVQNQQGEACVTTRIALTVSDQSQSDLEVVTDRQGDFELPAVPDGNYLLENRGNCGPKTPAGASAALAVNGEDIRQRTINLTGTAPSGAQ